jgi:hypothetical protein
MLAAFVEKIGGVFDKAFLIAALFPMFFILIVAGIFLAVILGPDAVLSALANVSSTSAAIGSTLLAMGIFFLAILLRGLRLQILELWCGTLRGTGGGPLKWALLRLQQRRFRALSPGPIRHWEGARQIFRTKFAAANEARESRDTLPEDRARQWLDAIEAIETDNAGSTNETRRQFDKFVHARADDYKRYSVESMKDVFYALDTFAERKEKEENIIIQNMRFRREILFGPPEILRTTTLGNIIEALDNYPVARYGMEGSVFWPHLEQLATGGIADQVREGRISTDLTLALATLVGLAAVLSASVGPWLWWNPLLWIATALLCAITSYSFYRAAVISALGLSTALRAVCDLFRRQVLLALDLQPPETLAAERDLWSAYNQLVAYGVTGANIVFRADHDATDDTAAEAT